MKIIVSKDTVKLNENHSENHYGEYNVNECIFEFDEYFDSVPIKKAIFTSQSNNKSFEMDIINNKCTIPHEVLTKVYDTVILGVYGYDANNDELLIRYSPTPDSFIVHDGSYRENAEKPEIITPSQYDMYSKALQEGLAEVDGRLNDVEKQGDYASEQGNYAKEQGDYAKEQGTNAKNVADDTQKKAEEGKFNGKSLEFIWQGTKLGVRLEGQEEYQFVDLQGVQGEIGATGEPFKIKKTYASVSEMNADFRNMAFGDYVMIASSVDVEDNAKLYTRGESAWIFISDFSGAMGIRGETGLTPNIKIGEVKTLEAGSQAKVTRSGSNEEPVFNFELPKGDKGDDYVLTEEDKVEIGEKVNTEYEKRIAENEKDIVDIESYLDSLTPKSPPVKGELVHITDALGLPMFETKTSGNVEQFTTSGNQLYNYKDQHTVSNSAKTDKNGWITISFDNTNGTSTSWENYWTKISDKLKPSTQYKIVLEVKSITGLFNSIAVISTNSSHNSQFTNGYTIYYADLKSNSIVVIDATTLDDFTNSVTTLRSFVTFNAGQSGSITFRLSVLEDTTVTPETFVYEPYTGGQASPNPEYPQEIEVLEGDLSYKVNGKNLFDLNYAIEKNYIVEGNVTTKPYYTIDNNGYLNATFTNASAGTLYLNKISLKAGTYTLQYKLNFTTTGERVVFVIANNFTTNTKIIDKTEWNLGTGDISRNFTFTLSEDSEIGFAFTPKNGTSTLVIKDIQLEKGSVATEIEPYQEQIVPLDLKGNWVGKISDDIKDYLVTDKKKYWLVKNVKRTIFDGSDDEAWRYASEIPRFIINHTGQSTTYDKNKYSLSNRFTYGDTSTNDNVFNLGGSAFFFRNESITSVEAWREDLANNNLVVYFPTLETEIIELGELPEPIKTFEGTSNIQVLANLDTELEVKYALDIKKYYDNKLAEISAQII